MLFLKFPSPSQSRTSTSSLSRLLTLLTWSHFKYHSTLSKSSKHNSLFYQASWYIPKVQTALCCTNPASISCNYHLSSTTNYIFCYQSLQLNTILIIIISHTVQKIKSRILCTEFLTRSIFISISLVGHWKSVIFLLFLLFYSLLQLLLIKFLIYYYLTFSTQNAIVSFFRSQRLFSFKFKLPFFDSKIVSCSLFWLGFNKGVLKEKSYITLFGCIQCLLQLWTGFLWLFETNYSSFHSLDVLYCWWCCGNICYFLSINFRLLWYM